MGTIGQEVGLGGITAGDNCDPRSILRLIRPESALAVAERR